MAILLTARRGGLLLISRLYRRDPLNNAMYQKTDYTAYPEHPMPGMPSQQPGSLWSLHQVLSDRIRVAGRRKARIFKASRCVVVVARKPLQIVQGSPIASLPLPKVEGTEVCL